MYFANYHRNMDLQRLSDSELLARYQQSRQLTLFSTLYLRHQRGIYLICLGLLKDPVQSEDVVMDLFIKLKEKVLTHSVEEFGFWVRRVAKNFCLDLLRKGRKEVAIDDFLFMESANEARLLDEAFSIEQQWESIESCLAKLNEVQRACVALFYQEGKSYKEISDMTGFDLGKVKSALQNGVRNLKICISKQQALDRK